MNITRILTIAYALVITSIGLKAGLPETLPMTPAALRAYVNNLPNKHGEVEVWGSVLQTDDDSYQEFDITEPGANGILKAIGDANVDFGVVDPTQKVGLGIYIYDDDWNTLYRYSSRKAVQEAKGGGYVLTDPTYRLELDDEIWIEVGEEIGAAQLVFTNRYGGVDRIVTLESEDGETGYYVGEHQLTGGAYLRLYIGEDWEEHFYSPDGKLVVPVEAEVHSLVGSIDGVIIVKGNWTEQTIYTYKGTGQNPTFEFHPAESGMHILPVVTSEGFAPLSVIVFYPNGEVHKFPAVVNGAWNPIGMKGGDVHQIIFEWDERVLKEDNGKG